MSIATVTPAKTELLAEEIEVLSCHIIAIAESVSSMVDGDNADETRAFWLLDTLADAARRVHELSCNICGF